MPASPFCEPVSACYGFFKYDWVAVPPFIGKRTGKRKFPLTIDRCPINFHTLLRKFGYQCSLFLRHLSCRSPEITY